jgi:general secretion pathway protein A
MYIKHFRLNESPFSLTPDPRYFFMSERHREGLAHLVYGIKQPGGFVLLTGEVGSGKTTLCRCLIKELPSETDVALILNPRLTALELLASICDELRIPHPSETHSIKVLIDALNQRLLENHAQGKRTAIIIDEAQNLSGDVLEQIRLLTNLETAKEKLLQIILIGQPELLTVLKRDELRQLTQRITARFHLGPMSREETSAYIRHRLLIAGRSDPIFTHRAIRKVYRLSSGTPRIINIICDRALLGAYAHDRRDVTSSIVGRASRETQGVKSRRLRYGVIYGILLIALLAIGLALYLNPSRLPVFYKNAAASTTTQKEIAKPKPAAFDQKKAEKVAPQMAEDDSAHLLEILKDPAANATGGAAFNALYSLWGVAIDLNPSDLGCKTGRERGFECLFQSGNWSRLRRFDLPAILEMALPDGRRKYAALVALSDTSARLIIGKKEHSFPLSEVDTLWSGAFILLWKPPFPPRTLSVGSSGKEVEWVSKSLDVFEGKPGGNASSSRFDENLKQRVLAFQRNQSLIQDGAVGSETLVRLAMALSGSKKPSISK